jgi:hypothetical protein
VAQRDGAARGRNGRTAMTQPVNIDRRNLREDQVMLLLDLWVKNECRATVTSRTRTDRSARSGR